MTAASSIRQSNRAITTCISRCTQTPRPKAKPECGRVPRSTTTPPAFGGQRAADIIAENLKAIYPYPWLVKTVPTTYLGEVAKTRAPGVLIEFAYHDNPEDATWIKEHIGEIAENVVLSLTEYFDIPFIPAQPSRQGTVTLNWGYLNIRQKPSTDSPVIGRAWDGNPITVLGQWENWYVVDYYGTIGYVDDRYVKLSPKQ